MCRMAELSTLRRLGAEKAQGYFLGRSEQLANNTRRPVASNNTSPAVLSNLSTRSLSNDGVRSRSANQQTILKRQTS